MKLTKVTSVTQARGLPEIPVLVQHIVTDPKTGITMITDEFPRFYPQPVDGEQILFFRESDGRLMEVLYNENGPAKREVI
jgi:hypothetical protein